MKEKEQGNVRFVRAGIFFVLPPAVSQCLEHSLAPYRSSVKCVLNEHVRPQGAWFPQDLSEYEVCMKGSRYKGTFVPSAPLYLVTAMLSPRKAAPCVCPSVPLDDKFLECWDCGSPGPWQCSLPGRLLFSHR